MKLREAIHWQADADKRPVVILAGVVLTLALVYLHYITGLAYEFHIFFSLPVLCVTWYAGAGAGYGVGSLAVLLWLVVDRMLGSDQAGFFPLLFNAAIRLALTIGEIWLLAQLRYALEREKRLARVDALTGMANRREFYELGRQSLAQAARQRMPFTAVFIDLDKFKEVNDGHGHETGDALLIRVADEMRRHVRGGDIVGRLGGDEFALLLPGMDGVAAGNYVEKLRQRLLAAMDECGWPVTFSIGIASYPAAPDDLDALLEKADGLMYEAKRRGRDRIVLQTCNAGETGGAGGLPDS
jgi:diguanylate cyclase (GGDEF)-like protein